MHAIGFIRRAIACGIPIKLDRFIVAIRKRDSPTALNCLAAALGRGVAGLTRDAEMQSSLSA